ncbi:DNA polymerase subunit gamma-2 [Rhinophrynus dorsalis]
MAVLEVGLAARKCERGLRRLKSCKPLIICNTRRYTSDPGDQAEDALYDLCQRRHFLSGQSLTRTSVLRGCHGLGPLGVELKRNLVSQWWESMVLCREQVLGIHTLHHMPRRSSPSENPLLSIGAESLKRLLQNRESTGDQLLWRLEASAEDYEILRPELLYGALEQYVSCLDLMNKKLPFGLAEVGPCFHLIPEENEDTSLPRIGERTVASLVWFSSPRTSGQWRDYWLRHRLQWWQKFAQCPSGFSCSDHQDDQGRKVTLIHYHFPWGKEPVESVSSVDDSSLYQVHSGSSAELQGRDGRRSVIPHILWMRGDVERGLLAYLSDAIQLKDNPGLRGKGQRRVLRIHPTLAPI